MSIQDMGAKKLEAERNVQRCLEEQRRYLQTALERACKTLANQYLGDAAAVENAILYGQASAGLGNFATIPVGPSGFGTSATRVPPFYSEQQNAYPTYNNTLTTPANLGLQEQPVGYQLQTSFSPAPQGNISTSNGYSGSSPHQETLAAAAAYTDWLVDEDLIQTSFSPATQGNISTSNGYSGSSPHQETSAAAAADTDWLVDEDLIQTSFSPAPQGNISTSNGYSGSSPHQETSAAAAADTDWLETSAAAAADTDWPVDEDHIQTSFSPAPQGNISTSNGYSGSAPHQETSAAAAADIDWPVDEDLIQAFFNWDDNEPMNLDASL
ncbi:hypothetical protein V6Z11_A07G227600 [Gossypium hirsutum]